MSPDLDPKLHERLRADFEQIPLPAHLGAIGVAGVPVRRRGNPSGVLAIVSVAVVVIGAVLVGRGLGIWRAAAPTGGAAPSTSAQPAAVIGADRRYGWLAASSLTTAVLVDETGGQRNSAAIGIVPGGVTSPNGRYIAYWQPADPAQFGAGKTLLRLLDGLDPTAGSDPHAALFLTDEHVVGNALAWASDNSAVVIVTTPDTHTRDNRGSNLRFNVRTIERTGAVRIAATLTAVGADVLGWDRSANRVAVRLDSDGTGTAWRYVTLEPGGSAIENSAVSDVPLAANGASRYVVSVRECDGCGRAFVVHDFLTYTTLADVPITSSGGWGVQFRPRSSDLLVSTESQDMSTITFTLTLLTDAGRGVPRELTSVRVPIGPLGTTQPSWLFRADGSALFISQPSPNLTWSGELIDVATGAIASLTAPAPIAAVVLDPALVAK